MFPSHGAAGSATDFDAAPSRAARPLARRHRVGRWTPRPAPLGFRVVISRTCTHSVTPCSCDGEQAVADGGQLSRLGGHVADGAESRPTPGCRGRSDPNPRLAYGMIFTLVSDLAGLRSGVACSVMARVSLRVIGF